MVAEEELDRKEDCPLLENPGWNRRSSIQNRSSPCYPLILILCWSVSCSPQPMDTPPTAAGTNTIEPILTESSPVKLVDLDISPVELEYLPLVERLLEAPLSPDGHDPGANDPLCLIPSSERLYYLQELLYPDKLPCASGMCRHDCSVPSRAL